MEFLTETAAALQASAYGAWARGPAYAGLNLAHLLGLVLLVGGIGAVDLRLCGLGRGVSVPALSAFLTPYAVVGLAISVVSGSGMFAADAASLIVSGTFLWKMALLLLALLNAVAFRALYRDRLEAWDAERPALGVAMAGMSLGIWIAVGALGRMIAYK